MICQEYHLDIELLPSLNEADSKFKQVILHLQQCPHCLARYEMTRKLDGLLEAELNELDPPASFSAKIMDYIKCSLMPCE